MCEVPRAWQRPRGPADPMTTVWIGDQARVDRGTNAVRKPADAAARPRPEPTETLGVASRFRHEGREVVSEP